MKRIKFFGLALALGLILAGCTGFYLGAASTPGPASSTAAAAPERVVLFDTPTLKITLDGLKTIVEDKPGGTVYTFRKTLTVRTSTPTLEERQARALGRVSADTETVRIVLSGALIVVTDKTADCVYYIH